MGEAFQHQGADAGQCGAQGRRVEVQNRQLSNASLDFTGALTMADLPALKALPRASGFEMDGFKLAAKNQGCIVVGR